MFAVHPKENCPHLEYHRTEELPVIKIPSCCFLCSDSSENWICLKCYTIGCSRFVSGHQESHFQQTGHCVAASFSDFSFWCYLCESYITHSSVQTVLQKLYQAKFGTDIRETKKEESSEDEEWNPNVKEEEEDKIGESDNQEISFDILKQILRVSFDKEETQCETVLGNDLTIENVAKLIKAGSFKNIIVMSGAGISVAAGIPDFRSPGTGLYDNLKKYGLPHPTSVFEINYFRSRPEPFYSLAKELYPGNFKPTACHYFIKLLYEKGLLLRNFTQNIDTLEREAGIPEEVLVEAHGSFASAHCIDCHQEEKIEIIKEAIKSEFIPKCSNCKGLVKPDIVFFGENLPSRFFEKVNEDFKKCDLLIIMGTSLQVQPFASLIGKVPKTTPRILINREQVGTLETNISSFGVTGSNFFCFGMKNNYRDISILGDCQEEIKKFSDLCGWKDDLETLIKKGNSFF